MTNRELTKKQKIERFINAGNENVKVVADALVEHGRKKERERIIGVLEDYFDGLVAIPNPQITKKKIIKKIKNNEKKETNN